ncbi:hypothetical protein OUZ56_012251 [Daphnia magna]|uniref:GMP synthase n=1 Tax=Daphnia magna TaxID=35525 RepID=A0ABQ9Z2G5_9CRUS|nr:hypothetical protein OUZ56_012251 [Daphnia magna]
MIPNRPELPDVIGGARTVDSKSGFHGGHQIDIIRQMAREIRLVMWAANAADALKCDATHGIRQLRSDAFIVRRRIIHRCPR